MVSSALASAVASHACKLVFEASSASASAPYVSGGCTRDWLKMKNPAAPPEAEEDWGR
jgi:hypothetical protein